MSHGKKFEVDKDVKQPSIVPAAEKVPSIQTNQNNGERLDRLESLVCSIQTTLTDMQDLARVSERMRRIDFMLSNMASIPLFDAYSQQIIDQLKLFVLEPGGGWVQLGFRGFVFETLASFRQGGGMLLPPDVAHWEQRSRPLTTDELKAESLKVHDMIVKHFRFLLGPGIWLEEDEEGKKMYYD